MSSLFRILNESFTYYTVNESAVWNGVACKSYTDSASGFLSTEKTIYVDNNDRIIGYYEEESYGSSTTYTLTKYEDIAYPEDFMFPRRVSGCEEDNNLKKVYDYPADVSDCAFAPPKIFVPATNNCAFRVTYTDYYESKKEPSREFEGWMAMYGQNLGQYQTGEDEEGNNVEVFSVVRVDIPDPNKPKTAGLFFGVGINGMRMCEFEGYNSYNNLYHDMDDLVEYFIENFSYDTMKEKDKWNDVECKSYTRSTTTIYADDNNRIIGIWKKGTYESDKFTIEKYEDKAYTSDFKMPSKFKGCDEDKVYEAPDDVPGCELSSIASSTEVAIFAVIMMILVSIF